MLITRVHRQISDKQAKLRLHQIQEFEELLSESGTVVLKFFLHISKEEQRERLEERIRDPEKRWKFNVGDLEERKLWDEYMTAFEDVISATSTDHAPWYIVPADHKWYRNYVVSDTIVRCLEELDLNYPPPLKNADKVKVV